MVSTLLLIFIPLTVFAIFRLVQSVKSRHYTQITVFSLVLAFCISLVVSVFKADTEFKESLQEEDAFIFEDLKQGDTAIFTGNVMYRRYEDPAIEDTIRRIDSVNDIRTGKSYFYLGLPALHGGIHLKTITIDLAARDNLLKYRDFQQQQLDSITYKLTIRARKESDGIWNFLNLIKVDTVKGIPGYWW